MIRTGCRQLQDQGGAALVIVLVMIVIVGLVAGVAGSSWKSIVQRAHEAELYWRGDQYRLAIQHYYEYSAGGKKQQGGQYPAKLEDLVKDPRSLTPVRHLRRLYTDPMTGGDWELIKDKGGRITGVRSSSDLTPFKQDGFPPEYESFTDASSYAGWEFIYIPKKLTNVSKTPAVPQTPEKSENP